MDCVPKTAGYLRNSLLRDATRDVRCQRRDVRDRDEGLRLRSGDGVRGVACGDTRGGWAFLGCFDDADGWTEEFPGKVRYLRVPSLRETDRFPSLESASCPVDGMLPTPAR